MGLFDIFKRKSKKKQQLENEKNQKENSEKNNIKASDLNKFHHSDVSSNENSEESNVNSFQSASDQVATSSLSSSSNNSNSSTSKSQSAIVNKVENEHSSQNSQATISSDENDTVKEAVNLESSDSAHSSKPQSDDDTLYEHGLAKSRSNFGQKLNALFAHFRSVDDEFFDDLEDTLIESDVGVNMAVKLSDQLRDEVKLRNAKTKSEVQNVIIKKLIDLYDQNGNDDEKIHFADKGPTVILFVGVNGAGKTTTIGKMANMYKKQGKKVLLAAADTFRAGAIEQLDVWAKRDGVDIVKKSEGSDPSSVVFDAVDKAKRKNYDILFVDTAGRLQNKVNLMNELMKMKKVLTRSISDAPHEVLLVLDATTGQNALSQAKLFAKDTNVTGIILTKLDGTAKGGIVLAIRNEMHLPVKYVGLGEGVNDLRPFDANEFIYGLFKGLFKENVK